jgi:hypothetical protein
MKRPVQRAERGFVTPGQEPEEAGTPAVSLVWKKCGHPRTPENSRMTGRYFNCLICSKASKLAWNRRSYAKNPQKHKNAVKKWKAKNRDRVLAYKHKEYCKNRDRYRAYSAKWRAIHHEKVLVYLAKWRSENPNYMDNWAVLNRGQG